MNKSENSKSSSKSPEHAKDTNDEDLSEELLSEGVETQAPLSIESLSKNMNSNPLWRTKRKQINTVKRPQIYSLSIEVVRNHKETKMKSALFSNTMKLDSPEIQLMPKQLLKDDIKMLLKEAAKRTKRLTLAGVNIKSNSLKINDPKELKSLEKEQSNWNVWFITMKDVDSWDE